MTLANGAWLLLAICLPAAAATVGGDLSDQNGAPVVNAVISLRPLSGSPPIAKPPAAVELDQRNREFIPHVLVAPLGAAVNFPNHDHILHHVYSFSPAKRFELKLYKDVTPPPVVFDQAGVAVLGCNIHDWMVAYVYVSDTPYYAQSDASGHWSIAAPAGAYRLNIWHPYLAGAPLAADVVAGDAQAAPLRFSLDLKTRAATGKPPDSLQFGEGYNGEP